ncbi:AraC family transcriptional regulator [Parabacteroides sp.]
MIKMKEGFKGERFVYLPEESLKEYSKDPLIGNLYVRKIGFFPKVKFHYVQKENGVDYAMLIYCTDGKGLYHIHGKTYQIEKNQYIIIPPYVPYGFEADVNDPWTIYWIHFRGKLVDSFLFPNPSPQIIQSDERSRQQVRISLFEETYNSFAMGYIKEYLSYSSMCLYTFLSTFIFQEQFRHIGAPTHNEISFSMRVIYYLQEHVEANLTLKDLAEYFKYSESHFSTLFQKETGTSPINYFTRLKIQKACQYIELTNMKLNEIAMRLGFEEQAYFSRVFTKVMGISPSAYRKKETDSR